MKKAFLLIISAALLLTSCSWFNNDPIQPLPIPVIPQFNTFTITGNLTANGAMPENFAQVMNSRTAIATAPTGQTIDYKVLLLANQNDATSIAGITSNISTDANGDMSYTIKYVGTDTTAVRYWLRAVAYYMDGSTEVDILASPATQLETAVDLKGGVFTKDLEMRPVTSGYGEVELDMTLASATMCDSITISDDTHFEITGTGTDRKIVHKATSAENPKVASGSYTVTVSFYKSQTINSVATNILVYQFDDVINVFNNLTTNKWVDNGNSPHLTTESGVTTCSITTAKLAAFNATNFYVDKNWTGEQNGTYAEPFKTVKYALQYVEAVADSTSFYTIHIRERGSFYSESFGSSSITISKKIRLEVYTSVPGTKNGIMQLGSISSSWHLTLAEGGCLIFESNGQSVTGYPTGATKGIGLYGCFFEVNGRFVMNGGYINGGLSYLVKLNNANAVFEMYGGSITGATANNYPTYIFKGVEIVNGTLKVAKKPYIYGSDQNVSLPDGKKIEVVGKLETGALIGVTTATPPTATEPVTITNGYGYQTGGYNEGVLPGTYFRGDEYGVTQDGDPDSGEAVLKISGGSITSKVRDDITIDIDKYIATRVDSNSRKFTFTVTKDKGAVSPATSTNVTSATGVHYNYILYDHTDEVATASGSTHLYTMPANAPTGTYRLHVAFSYQGNTYNADFDITYANVTTIPTGCVITPAGFFNGLATLCDGDTTDRQSKLFVAGRSLSIPILIASDHEVTQGEYERYCIYGTHGSPSVAKGKNDAGTYPAYFVSWFDTIVYCNLCTMNDTNFGTTPAERLNHCAYSLNGEKDPSKWNGIEEGTGVTAGKYCGPSNTTDVSNSITQLWGGIEFNVSADGWRLPTGVEWEYLARGGNLTDEEQFIFSGSNTLSEIGWQTATKCHTIQETIEASKSPNALGLYNMSGNIEEYCWDRCDYNAPVDPDTPATGPASLSQPDCSRMLRGAPYGLSTEQYYKNCNFRHDQPWHRFADSGFRVVRNAQ